jgi:uncharacterized membrane protein YjgN (DUF898 family)
MIEQTLETDTPLQLDDEAPPAFGFSGSGAEYFRIWIVNLLLTVATLGIYSAWAKTRRLQYFYRNTQLAGASFDFRGDPRAILRGRILAVVLLVAYHYAFGFSLEAGVVVVAVLLAGLPFMMLSALRFRLSNVWYRGLPFGFCGSVRDAYRVYLLPVAVFVLPGAMIALMPNSKFSGAAFLLYLAWPLIHGATRCYQQEHLMYGNQRAGFSLTTTELATPYLQAVFAAMALLLLFAVTVIVGMSLGKPQGMNRFVYVLIVIVLAYLMIVLTGPLIVVRMNNLAWSATAFPGVEIACTMRARTYLRLQTVNVVLTLLTLGLFRPFAAVRTWRYRVAHLSVAAPAGLEQAARMAVPRSTAAGDGVADFLGVDLSW